MPCRERRRMVVTEQPEPVYRCTCMVGGKVGAGQEASGKSVWGKRVGKRGGNERLARRPHDSRSS